MRHSLKYYPSVYEANLNYGIMNKEFDRPLKDHIEDVWKSLEVVQGIKVVGFDYSEHEADIDINRYIFKRDKKKKRDERFDYKFIKDDRFGLLTAHLEVTLPETDKETNVTTYHVYPIKKSILIPLMDEDGYFYLKGNKYYLIYQMVEKSTYTSSQSVTLKSLMPIAVKRNIIEASETLVSNITNESVKEDSVDVQDVIGKTYKLPFYTVFVFKKEIPIILFYLAHGLDFCLNFLEVSDVLDIVSAIPDYDDYDEFIYFQLSGKCFIKVLRPMFEKYQYIQSIVGSLCYVTTNRVTINQLNDKRTWIKKIGNGNTDKGYDTLKFFNRLLDESTKKIIRVHPYHVENIYTLLRWIMQNYQELRLKDNLDLKNKRLRCNEYIASLLTMEFSRRISRIISLGDKVTIENIREIFKFPGEILIQKMNSSGILRFDDAVNDLDFFSKFKYTSKGPHSLGVKNSNNIGVKYRDIHPSYLGYIDIFVCGNSDRPRSGLAAMLSANPYLIAGTKSVYIGY